MMSTKRLAQKLFESKELSQQFLCVSCQHIPLIPFTCNINGHIFCKDCKISNICPSKHCNSTNSSYSAAICKLILKLSMNCICNSWKGKLCDITNSHIGCNKIILPNRNDININKTTNTIKTNTSNDFLFEESIQSKIVFGFMRPFKFNRHLIDIITKYFVIPIKPKGRKNSWTEFELYLQNCLRKTVYKIYYIPTSKYIDKKTPVKIVGCKYDEPNKKIIYINLDNFMIKKLNEK